MAVRPLSPALTELSIEELRTRRSVKWTQYPDDVLPAWVAEMDFPVAPPIVAALGEAIDRSDTGYANPTAGPLAAELAGFAARRMGWSVDPAQVVACHDVVAGLTELLRVMTEPGEGVVINPPVYHPFFNLIPAAGRELVEVPLLDGRKLDLDGVEEAFAAGARAIVLCSPHNPTGAVLARPVLERLAEIAAEHDAWVLSDEIHAPLTLPGAEHLPFISASTLAAERGVTLISASKSFNLAGLGCAQIVTASESAAEAVWRLSDAARHCGHFGAIAAEVAYAEGDEWLDDVLAVLDHNRTLLGDLLGDALPGVGYVQPEAGYLAWLDVSGFDFGDDPAPAIAERGRVALSTGPWFGQGGEGFVRLNFGTSPALVEEAVDRLARAATGSND